MPRRQVASESGASSNEEEQSISNTPPKKLAKSRGKSSAQKRAHESRSDQTPSPSQRSPPRQKPKQGRGTPSPVPPPIGDEDNEDGDQPMAEIEDLLNVEIPPKPQPIMQADGSGNRLMITQIVSENFKSYYGRHVLGPFHKNFTSIIGPNGSGKSNVIDSLLFVFGFRAQKIRLKKLSQLIHSSQNHQNLDFCSVEVHFQKIRDIDDEKYEVVSGTNFMVKRIAYKNNSCNYYLDGKMKQFKDVAARLRAEGIDLHHNRFLILQGEVEQIALMKPKAANENEEGMLEYLEDIIGSSRLKPFIEQLSTKVDELNDFRTEKLNRVKVALKDKQVLEPQMKETIGILKLENQYTRIQHKLLQLGVYRGKGELTECEDMAETAKVEYDKASANVEHITKKKEERDQMLDQLRKKETEFSKQKDELQAKFDECTRKDIEFREDIKLRRNKIAKLEKDITSETKKRDESKAYPIKAEKEIEALKENNKELLEKEAEAEKCKAEGMQKLAEQTAPLQAIKTKHEQKLMGFKKTANEAKSKMDIAQSELDLQTRHQTSEQKKLDALTGRLTEVNQLLQNKQHTRSTAESRIPSTKEKFETSLAEIRGLKNKEKQLADKIRIERPKVEEMKSKMASRKNEGKLLAGLMEAVRRKSLRGIKGRLGDLGSIEDKYDVAISSTCGALECIVTDTTDDATKALQFVKDHSLGQVTFIMLDKQRELIPRMKQRRDFPEGVARMFDLVKCDDDVAPAFYFALRDTLVAKDLDQATRIGLGGRERHRVVTLKGELVDPSGTMTGGGNQVKKGRMGRSAGSASPAAVSVDRVHTLEEDVVKAETQLAETRQKLRGLEEEQERCRRELDQMESTLKKLNTEITNLEDEVQRLEPDIAKQEKTLRESAPDPEETKAKEKVLEEARQRSNEASSACSGIEGDVKKVEEDIETITDNLVGASRRIIIAAKKEYEDNKKMINKAQAKCANSDRDVKKIDIKLEAMAAELEETKETVEQLRVELKDLEPLALEYFSRRREAEEAETKAKSEHEAAKKGLNDLNPELEAANTARQELKQELKSRKENVTAKKKYIDTAISTMKRLDLRDLSDLLELKKSSSDATLNDKKLKQIKQSNSQPQRESNEDNQINEPNTSGEAGGENEAREEEAEPMETEVDSDEEEVNMGTQFDELTEEQLKQFDEQKHKIMLNAIKTTIDGAKPNEAVIADFRKKHAKYLSCVGEFENATRRRDDHRHKYDDLRKLRLTEFQNGFTDISSKLKEMYQMITLGGDAELNAVDSMDPFSEGIAFEVRPPKKSWKQITNLSGGEKTLSSLALVFALHYYRPTPLYVMDEIDAALDYRNVSIIGHYLKERTKNAQFIVISLRNQMYELADRLVGIYKTFDCTKHAVINPSCYDLLPCQTNNQNVQPSQSVIS